MSFIGLHKTCSGSRQGQGAEAGAANMVSDLHTVNDNPEQNVSCIELLFASKHDHLLPCLTCTLGGRLYILAPCILNLL